MKMDLHRLSRLLHRRYRAHHLGVDFRRSASFELPTQLIIDDELHQILLPNENGVKVAFIELLLDDDYGCRHLQNRSSNIRTVLDIGANVGIFSLAARCAFPNAVIHGYEPNHLLEPYLSVQSSVARSTYFLEAVGSRSGRVDLEINTDSVLTRVSSSYQGSVPMVSLSDCIDRIGGEVDLLKLDCEGSEWDLFEDKKSWTAIRNIAMEYHLFDQQKTLDMLHSILRSLGYQITMTREFSNFGIVWASKK